MERAACAKAVLCSGHMHITGKNTTLDLSSANKASLITFVRYNDHVRLTKVMRVFARRYVKIVLRHPLSQR